PVVTPAAVIPTPVVVPAALIVTTAVVVPAVLVVTTAVVVVTPVVATHQGQRSATRVDSTARFVVSAALVVVVTVIIVVVATRVVAAVVVAGTTVMVPAERGVVTASVVTRGHGERRAGNREGESGGYCRRGQKHAGRSHSDVLPSWPGSGYLIS
ncbi:hypothetical protein, partial [Streptomyces roseochromogenus]|uniref:hypothetical protein n=1 Tax=Streptomyces roseochromogenus TaxID=285450 RepID=UPI0004CF9AF4